jgi:hypothetical protein
MRHVRPHDASQMLCACRAGILVSMLLEFTDPVTLHLCSLTCTMLQVTYLLLLSFLQLLLQLICYCRVHSAHLGQVVQHCDLIKPCSAARRQW